MMLQNHINGMLSAAKLRRLVIGLFLLLTAGLALGVFAVSQLQGISAGLANIVSSNAVPAMKPLAEAVQQDSEFAIVTLFTLLLFAVASTGLLLWKLTQTTRLAGFLSNSVSDGIAVIAADGSLISANPAFTSLIGMDEQSVLGRQLADILPSCDLQHLNQSRKPVPYDISGTRNDGSSYVAKAMLFTLQRRQGEVIQAGVVLKDVTDIHQSEAKIRAQSFVDDLTGLANKAHLLDRIDTAISAAERYHRSFAILYLDLDGFKDVNDSLGREAGDELLKVVADRLNQELRGSDFVARINGDEFCVILENLNSTEFASRIAVRLLEIIAESLTLQDRRLQPQASIGIAMYPEHGTNRDTLLQVADTAMYAAKRAGKHQFAYYSPELTRLADLRLSLEHDLRNAIAEDEFFLVYQPQVSLISGQMIGVEALVRWQHPERGLIMPDRFIPVAERIGVIRELGEWVLKEACRQTLEWQQDGVVINMAVNISGTHFQSASLYDAVEENLSETGISPGLLELEVTEGVMQVAGDSIENFHRLKTLGINIAIDDFGTGYSSLSSLKSLPVDHLKVDRAFLQDVLKDEKQAVIIATIIGMARALELKVIVEGVETKEHLSFLQGLGCNTVQGYYFSKPVAANEIPAIFYDGFGHGENADANSPSLTGWG